MIQITDEYIAIAKEFKKVFGYGVPLAMIPPTADMDEFIRNVRKCIDEKKDDLLEQYHVHTAPNILF